MSSTSMSYIVRGPDGKEYGPIDQETVVQWAEDGRITTDFEIANVLTKSWSTADKVPFLKGKVRETEEAARKKKKKKTPEPVNLDDIMGPGFSLNRPGVFKYKPAPANLRAGAFIMDTAILGGVLLIGLVICHQAGGTPQIWLAYTVLALFWVLGYYTTQLAFRAQTFGQWFFGIMIAQRNGAPCLAFRALCFSVFHLLLFWTTWLLVIVLPSKRALPDFLSGTVIMRTVMRDAI